jgi:protein-disulfide isomerase
MAEEKKRVVTIKLPGMNLWMVISLILIIVLVLNVTGLLPFNTSAFALGGQDAANKAVDYINNNIVQTGKVEFVSVKEFNGMYMVTVNYQSREIPVYITKDGSSLFLSSPLNTSEVIPTETTNTTSTASEIPKTEKPTADLYVMGFCPYGVQAENTMKPVFDLLGAKANINIHFIVQVTGTTVDSVQSLHGATEAQEDLRQVCVMKNYDKTTYWKYLTYMDNSCYGKITTTDAAALDTCWKAAAATAGINTTKIDTCSKGSEGLDLLKADEALTNQYSVSGSPTLIINGETYSGARTSEAFKAAICSGFNTPPAECSQNITSTGNSTAAAASGGCAS